MRMLMVLLRGVDRGQKSVDLKGKIHAFFYLREISKQRFFHLIILDQFINLL